MSAAHTESSVEPVLKALDEILSVLKPVTDDYWPQRFERLRALISDNQWAVRDVQPPPSLNVDMSGLGPLLEARPQLHAALSKFIAVFQAYSAQARLLQEHDNRTRLSD